uniref:Uncharacterized protein n=1 Tax=Avena sativa TaxID=4498 RepID=A0ACD5T8Y1_AVESA
MRSNLCLLMYTSVPYIKSEQLKAFLQNLFQAYWSNIKGAILALELYILAMRLLQILLIFFMVFSNHVSAISWLQNPYLQHIFAFGEQSSSNSSLLLAKTGRESMVNHYACYDSNTFPESVLTGGMGSFDVYSFTNLKNNQVSISALWIRNQKRGDYSSLNGAAAGWEVNLGRYGDSKTHFFSAWTADGFKSTGCKNLDCDGFVPVNYAPITPGDIIEATSEKTIKITIKIFRSKDDGDWWLHFGYDSQNLSRVGYWPKNIFNNMVDHANLISWGGGSLNHLSGMLVLQWAMGNGLEKH